MKYFILSFFLFLLSINTVISQTYWIAKTPLWDSLYHWKCSISEISDNQKQSYLPVYINGANWPQTILKCKNGLYVFVDGTGQVYKATGESKNELSFTRIDSTTYIGYNIGAINFSFNDTLFSYGGSGFWITNGILRYFNNRKEWEAFVLENVYPSTKYIYNYLPKKSKIYYVQLILYKKLGNYNKEEFAVIEINLDTKKNQLLGILNPELVIGFSKMVHINSPELNGTLILNKEDIYLYRFIDNTVYKLVNKTIYNQMLLGDVDGSSNIFELNSRIYYTKFNRNDLYSFPISLKDFEKTQLLLFIPIKNNNLIYYISLALLIIAIFYFCFIYYRNRKVKKNSNSLNYNKLDSNELILDAMDFNSIETSLIEQIISKANKSELFSVTELNNSLGLNKKSLEIQKKVRTETINRINHKFQVKYNKESVLIERIRSDDDRRFYLYTISAENAKLFSHKV